jgi:ABC-type lipoprotein export system ATPase subunit
MSAESAVVCRELFKVHRTPEGDAAALQGLTLDAAPGEMLALLGPSGSGKSTLLRILAGLERPSAGTALVTGRDLGRLTGRALLSARRELVGLVGQHAERALPPALAVADAIAMPLRLRGASRTEAGDRARALLERVGLEGFEQARPGELSGGERQRVAVCAAVAHRPPVVLADEPTGELDAVAAREVLDLLASLASDDGATVVLVTHDPVGARTADRVVRIRDGRVSQEGSGERRAVVVGRGGWLHVPEELLAAAGITDRARVRAQDGSVILEPLDPATPVTPADGAGPAQQSERVDGVPAALRGVVKRYGRRTVFDGLAAEFAVGTLTAVTGRSGSGKSTLLRMLAGLERADAGEIVVGAESLVDLGREELAALRARRIGFVAQEPQLAGFLAASEQAALPLLLAGEQPEAAARGARSWLSAVGLDERAEQRVARLSAGERQRVAIARALAGGRGLLLVDEPTSHLDEATAAATAELLRRAAHVHGATVVCATHDPVLVEAADAELPLDPAAVMTDSI